MEYDQPSPYSCTICSNSRPSVRVSASATPPPQRQRTAGRGAHIFEVVHLQNLVAAVPHPEDLDAATRVDLHHAVRLHAVHHRFVLMVVHLQPT